MIRRHAKLYKEHFIENQKDKDAWDDAHDDLFRAGIVLSVAAMDAYFTDRFCEGLIKYIEKNELNDYLEKILSNSGLNIAKSIEILDNKRPKRVLSNMVRRHLSRHVTQNFKTIDKLYKALGFEKPLTICVQERSNRVRLLSSVTKLIERRHKIVHSGDYNQHGRLNQVDYRYMLRKIIEVRRLVDSCDEELFEAGI